jgi:hypothetical protein
MIPEHIGVFGLATRQVCICGILCLVQRRGFDGFQIIRLGVIMGAVGGNLARTLTDFRRGSGYVLTDKAALIG